MTRRSPVTSSRSSARSTTSCCPFPTTGGGVQHLPTPPVASLPHAGGVRPPVEEEIEGRVSHRVDRWEGRLRSGEMTTQFEGKVALVTGAASGIGRASALAFAREGAKTVVADLVVAGGEDTVRMIKEAGGDARFVRTDVSKSAVVEGLMREDRRDLRPTGLCA